MHQPHIIQTWYCCNRHKYLDKMQLKHCTNVERTLWRCTYEKLPHSCTNSSKLTDQETLKTVIYVLNNVQPTNNTLVILIHCIECKYIHISQFGEVYDLQISRWWERSPARNMSLYLRSESLHEGSSLNSYSRSRSFSVVVSSISTLSADRPCVEPFKSNRRWIRSSVQNMLPITTNRTWNHPPKYFCKNTNSVENI